MTTTYVALNVLALHHRPETNDRSASVPAAFGGFALLVAERDDDGGWSFALTAETASNAEQEARALEYLADILPLPDHLIGWNIGSTIVEPIVRIAETLEPVLRHFLLMRLHRAANGATIDLSLAADGTRGESLSEAAAKRPSIGAIVSRQQIEIDWFFADNERVIEGLRAEVIALWRLFLAIAPRACADDAATATEAWIAGGAK